MEELLSIPVRLVVKAPNQKIADQTVECALDWTVRKLKEHLASVYPSKPLENQQRIIYSGQLLQDDVTLKDILKQYEPNQMTHTVHLVCAPTTESLHTPVTTTGTATAKPAGAVPGVSSADGLRFRRNAAAASTPASETPQQSVGVSAAASSLSFQAPQSQYTAPFGSYYAPQQYNPYMQAYPPVSTHLSHTAALGIPQTFGATTGLMEGNGGGIPSFSAGVMIPAMGAMGYGSLNPQTMWMQQAYAQYVSQYMQYYQQTAQAYNPHVTESISSQTTPQPPNQVAPPIQPQAAANPVAARAAAPNPAVRMNAQGGAVMDDDDEEEPNRDWLDWVYTLIRFAMLLCILYFYSNLSRFVTTLTFIIFIWLYQGGWLRLNRRARDQPQNGAAAGVQQRPGAAAADAQQRPAAGAAAAGVQQQAAAVQQQQHDLAANRVVNQGNDAAPRVADNQPEPVVNPVDQPEPPIVVTGEVGQPPVAREPGPLMFAWNFFIAFFGSLAPQQPPAVNAN